MGAQIEVQGICKRFTVLERPEGKWAVLRSVGKRVKRTVEALKELSFQIPEGQLVGYIGPNGAGKSTTVKVMSGILTPESGQCSILGKTPWINRVEHVEQLGVVFGQRSQLWWDVPVSDSFLLLRDIYGISKPNFNHRLRELSNAMELEPLLKTPARQLSLGQRMRCEVAAALLHRPRILFLDEPTIGLDAVSKLALRAFLKEENRQHGVTMILTTHDMDDIEALCSRVMTIGHGRLLFDGSIEQLRGRFSRLHRLKASFEQELVLPPLPGVERIEQDGRQYSLWFDSANTPAHVLIGALSACAPLKDVTVQEQDIDEIVAGMYKEMDL